MRSRNVLAFNKRSKASTIQIIAFEGRMMIAKPANIRERLNVVKVGVDLLEINGKEKNGIRTLRK